MKKKRKNFSSLILVLALTLVATSSAFADVSEIPMKLTVKGKVLDYQITESITMNGVPGSDVMNVGDLTITNNAPENSMYLKSVSYKANVNPWQLVSDSTNFKTMQKNQHKFSLVADGADLFAGAKEYTGKEIGIGGSYTVVMDGKTGVTTEAITNQQVGTVVVTVGLEDA